MLLWQFFILVNRPILKKVQWKWSNGQRARLLLGQSDNLIPLRPTAFSVKIMFEKAKNIQKVVGKAI